MEDITINNIPVRWDYDMRYNTLYFTRMDTGERAKIKSSLKSGDEFIAIIKNELFGDE